MNKSRMFYYKIIKNFGNENAQLMIPPSFFSNFNFSLFENCHFISFIEVLLMKSTSQSQPRPVAPQ